MKQRSFLLLLLSFTFVSLTLTGCFFIKPVKVGNISKLQIHEIGKGGISLEVGLPIKNPNFLAFKITELNLEVAINDIQLGTVNTVEQIVIPAKSDQVHSLKIQLKLQNMLTGLFQLVPLLSKKNAMVHIKGKAKAKSMLITKVIEIDQNNKVELFKD